MTSRGLGKGHPVFPLLRNNVACLPSNPNPQPPQPPSKAQESVCGEGSGHQQMTPVTSPHHCSTREEGNQRSFQQRDWEPREAAPASNPTLGERRRPSLCFARPVAIGRSRHLSPNPSDLTSPRAGWRSQCPAAPRRRRRPAPRERPALAAASWSRRPPSGPRTRSWGAGSGAHRKTGCWSCGPGGRAPRQDARPRRPPDPGRPGRQSTEACLPPGPHSARPAGCAGAELRALDEPAAWGTGRARGRSLPAPSLDSGLWLAR